MPCVPHSRGAVRSWFAFRSAAPMKWVRTSRLPSHSPYSTVKHAQMSLSAGHRSSSDLPVPGTQLVCVCRRLPCCHGKYTHPLLWQHVPAARQGSGTIHAGVGTSVRHEFNLIYFWSPAACVLQMVEVVHGAGFVDVAVVVQYRIQLPAS